MIGEPCSSYINEVVSRYPNNKKVYYIEVNPSLLTMSDKGADWHPNISGQQKTADVVLPIVKNIMGW